MSLVTDLYNGTSNVDFRPKWRKSLIVSGVLLVGSLAFLGILGLNLSIDFEGGGKWQVPVSSDVTVADGREAVAEVVDDARVQTSEGPNGQNLLQVQSSDSSEEVKSAMVETLAELGGVSVDDVIESTVGPTWGDQITKHAVRALAFFFVIVAIYLAFMLESRMAVGALVAVVHDLAITAGLYALFGFTVSPATVIALLTIIGYSIYDTVVVYDKVKENQKSAAGDRFSPSDLINESMNAVLMRSINTTITTVLPVFSMLVIGGLLLGGSALLDFALALFIGLTLGTYSSLFVAAPVLVWLKERQLPPEERTLFAGRSDVSVKSGSAAISSATDEPSDVSDKAASARPKTGSVAAGSGRPRPRKKKRK